jgi:hypothetical protein
MTHIAGSLRKLKADQWMFLHGYFPGFKLARNTKENLPLAKGPAPLESGE